MGVEASIEMQRVAQAVNVQNQRLKSLLGVYGISKDEIERYLSSSEGDHQISSAQHRCTTCGRLLPGIPQTRVTSMHEPFQNSLGSSSSMAGDAVPVFASGSSNPTLPTSAEPPIGSILMPREGNKGVFVLPAKERGFHGEIHAANGRDDTTAGTSSAPTEALSPLSGSFDSSDPIICHSKRSEPLETSCDKAAKILVELHNHADLSWARSALGCHGDSSCSVKNTKIFQLMDHLN